MDIYISVIIPLFNEEKRLLYSFEVIQNELRNLTNNYELIFIDDGSTDKTPVILEEIKKTREKIIILKNNENKGKGYSLRKGILIARGLIILTTDIDLSVPIHFLHKFITTIEKEKSDLVIGTRRTEGAKITKRQPLLRRTLSNIYRWMARLLINSTISDFTCGFKLYKNQPARELFASSFTNRWGIDAEILYLAKKKNFKITEVPVEWKDSGDSRVNLYHDVLFSLYELIMIKWKHRFT